MRLDVCKARRLAQGVHALVEIFPLVYRAVQGRRKPSLPEMVGHDEDDADTISFEASSNAGNEVAVEVIDLLLLGVERDGGITMEKTGPGAFTSARNSCSFTQNSAQRGSIWCGSYALAISRGIRPNTPGKSAFPRVPAARFVLKAIFDYTRAKQNGQFSGKRESRLSEREPRASATGAPIAV